MSGVQYCLSAIGSGSSQSVINGQVNASNGLISNISNVLQTVPLVNFGPSNSEWCADTVCFTEIETVAQICAIFIHDCATGQIRDWQSPVLGHSCPDNQLCIDLTCFKIEGACSEPEVDVDLCCEDPCEILCMLRNARLKCALGPVVLSWKNRDKSTNYGKPNIEDLKCLENEYATLCRQSKCQSNNQFMPYYPRRPC